MRFDYQANTEMVLTAENNAPRIGATFTAPAPVRNTPRRTPRRMSRLGRWMFIYMNI